ncbi:MAG: porin [Planctomycetota bacterium]
MRLSLTTLIALFLSGGTALGQTAFPTQAGSPQAVTPVRYSMQDKDDQQSAEEKLKRMELRLRELENDVTRIIESSNSNSSTNDQSLQAKIESLEETLGKQEEAIDKIDSTLPNLLFHSHKGPKLRFFGRIHLDYWSFPKVDNTINPLEGGDDPQDRWAFRRLRIGVEGDLNDNMFYKYEGEFAPGNNPSYRDALFGFKNVPYLNTVTFGNQKRPYSLDQLNNSNDNVFIERPFVAQAFNRLNRRLGISSSGHTEDLGWNWLFGYYNQILTQEIGGFVGDKYQGEVAARIARTAWYDESSGGRGWAHFAIAGSAGAPNGFSSPTGARYRTRPESQTAQTWFDTGDISGANENLLVGLEAAINVGQFNITGEYMRINVDRLDAIGEDVAFEGYYGQVSYFLTGEHRVWNRKVGKLGRVIPLENFFTIRDCDCNVQNGWGAWEVAARYSFLDMNDQDIFGGEGESFTFGLNWYWNPYARMQFNYILGDIDRGAAGFGDYEVFGVRMMVDF